MHSIHHKDRRSNVVNCQSVSSNVAVVAWVGYKLRLYALGYKFALSNVSALGPGRALQVRHGWCFASQSMGGDIARRPAMMRTESKQQNRLFAAQHKAGKYIGEEASS